MRPLVAALAASLGLLLSFALAAGVTLEVREPWIREAPPAASVMAAYMIIRNEGDSPAEITSITSPEFDHAELHRTMVESGVAKMVPVEKLRIPAGSEISLEPGGIHLMLFNPRRLLREGDSVTLVIHRADGICNTYTISVIRAAADAGHQHQ
jgi:hypothetical protein